MASTYSTDLKLELMVTGENAGTWGNKTNTNLNLIQQAIAGYQGVSIAGGAQTTALTMDNAQISNARNMVIEFTGAITGNQIVTIPNGIEKYYILKNSTTGAFTVTFKYASTGSGILLTQGYLTAAYGDGSEIYKVDLSTLQGTIATAQIANLAVTSGKLASFAVTTARINSLAVTSTRLASLAVTSAKIASFAVTTARINTAAVTATRLANTAVTAGTYNAATITVDAQGRITAASSGSAGAGMAIMNLGKAGPASGTYTATPTANRLGVYMIGGGGNPGANMGRPMCDGPSAGGAGGPGGYGFYNKPITQPFSQPYSVAARAAATNFTNVGTVNQGNNGNNAGMAGADGNPGNPGNAPGAALVYDNRNFLIGGNYGGNGQPGYLAVFENTGT